MDSKNHIFFHDPDVNGTRRSGPVVSISDYPQYIVCADDTGVGVRGPFPEIDYASDGGLNTAGTVVRLEWNGVPYNTVIDTKDPEQIKRLKSEAERKNLSAIPRRKRYTPIRKRNCP